MSGTRSTPLDTGGPSGSIYDLGYQGYDGPRLGRSAAVRALFIHTIRSCYGLGRGGRAKIVPLALGALALLPAVLAVGISALVSQAGAPSGDFEEANPIRYSSYHEIVGTLVLLFTAAQAPELLGRDQRSGVLPLYFSRALERIDYALAKAAGLGASLLVLILFPQVILFVGRVLAAPDPLAGLTAEAPNLPPVFAQALLTAGLFGGLATAISAYTPRRAYATAAIIGGVLIPSIIALVVGRAAPGDFGRALLLLSPSDVLDGTNAFLFDVFSANPAIVVARLEGLWYVAAGLIGIAVSLGLTIRRYQRIST